MNISKMELNFKKMEIFDRNKIVCIVENKNNKFEADLKEKSIFVPFKNGTVSVEQVYSFLLDRVFDGGRPDKAKILSALGLEHFDAFQISKKTNGVLFQDEIWLRFDDQDINWEKIKEILYG